MAVFTLLICRRTANQRERWIFFFFPFSLSAFISASLSQLCLSLALLDISEENLNQNEDLLKLIASLSIHLEKQHWQTSNNFIWKEDGRSDPD